MTSWVYTKRENKRNIRGGMAMKKKLKLMGLAATLLVVAVIGGSLAYFRAETDTQTPISVGNLGVELLLDLDETKQYAHIKNNIIDVEGGMPGDDYYYPVYAYNTGDYDSYIRITLTRYWENQIDGTKNFDAEAGEIGLQLNGEKIEKADNWTQMGNWIIDARDENKEVVYMYYKMPVKAGEGTSHAIDNIVIGDIKDREFYSTLKLNVDVEVDAIQTVAAKDAILAEWGMDVTFDADGNISQVE